MPGGLKKKIGPLPLWAWAIVAGIAIGGTILIMRNRAGSTSDGSAVDTGNTSAGIDPTTGMPYASEFGSGGGLTSGGTAPTLAQEIADTTGVISALQTAGLWPTAAQAGSGNAAGLVDLAPGHSYYDPVTGEVVSGPEQAAVSQASGVTTSANKAPSALERAAKAVTTGKIGTVNRGRLNKAGFTDAQIDFHLKSKTPLGQPHGTAAVKAEQKKQDAAKHSAAPSHPNTHVTAAKPDHGTPPSPKQRLYSWGGGPAVHTISEAEHKRNVALPQRHGEG